MAVLNNRYGQVKGSFPAGQDLLGPGGAIDEMTPESSRPQLKKLGIIAEEGTKYKINGNEGEITKFGVFELDDFLVYSLVFPNGADATIDYVW